MVQVTKILTANKILLLSAFIGTTILSGCNTVQTKSQSEEASINEPPPVTEDNSTSELSNEALTEKSTNDIVSKSESSEVEAKSVETVDSIEQPTLDTVKEKDVITSTSANEPLELEDKVATVQESSSPSTAPVTNTSNSKEITAPVVEKAVNEAVKKVPVAQKSKKELMPPTKAEIGTSFGIWTLAKNAQGECMLTTPTFQIRDGDFSAQFWLDILSSQFILSASLTLHGKAASTGISFDEGELIGFTDQLLPSKVSINKDVTIQLGTSNHLNVYLNSEELGKKILSKKIVLNKTNEAVAALKGCN